MKCAEVMEWMHRYIDQDMSQAETAEMFRHIDNCSSCAEVFERLSLLSQELEQLPDVLPPFSLVDSILPKLAELDQIGGEQQVGNSEDSVVVPFTSENARRKLFKRNSVAARTGIGAIAAAVILGIAILNMPDKMPSADVDHMLQNSVASDHSASDNAAALDAGNSTSDMASKSGMAPSNTDEATAGNAEKSPLAASQDIVAAPPESAKADEATSSDQAGGTTEATGLSGTPAPNVTSGARSIQEPTVTKKTEPVDTNTLNKREISAKVQSPESNSANSDQNMADDSVADIASSMSMEDSAGSANDYSRGIMSFKAMDDSNVQTWTSPDEKYAIEFVGLQLVIYKNSPSGSDEERTAVTSYPLLGTFVSGEWSQDSSMFTYVTEKDGVSSTNVYTVHNEEPNASAPAASPVTTPAHSATSSSTN